MIARLLPSLLAALAVIVNAFIDPISNFVAAHPTVSLVLGALATVLANIVKSPVEKE